ncbi:motility associated factor glycosyltransferase family protein [Ectobacillus funiculus]|uniref:Motility associated factor glycosyltransferase family protein n=1 Tax=Ectobacillus funiculus TaxID=137993 RepID=A0ABV5WMK8_9BACI
MSKPPANLYERNELFQKNLQCFPEYIKQQIRKVDLEEVEKWIDIVYTKEGDPICKYEKDGKVKHINSRNPWEEAKNWCNQLPLNQMSTLFVYGCGFGYPLIELLKRVHENSWVVVFESELPIFVAMLHYFDLEPVFRIHNKCIFFLGPFEEFSQFFQNFISTYGLLYLTVPSVLFTPTSRLFKKEYLNIQSHIFERLTQKIFSYGNDHYDSLLGFHNMIENVEKILQNPYLSSLKDKFANAPAFIVANGPSLDQSMHELKQVKGKALILCCESAIVPLMKNDIKPDAICVLERIPESYLYHFQDKEYPEDIALLALAVADPRTFASFTGPKIPIFRSFESTSQWINRIVGNGSGLYAGLNVSHLAYELAVYMGANPIVFVGQNFAYGLDGLTHSKQSKYTEDVQGYIEKVKSLPVVYVEGNDGSKVPSNPLWVEFRKGLEQLIEQTPHVTIINATEGGAKIKGTISDTLTNVIEKYCKTSLSYTLDMLLNESKENLDVSHRKNKIKSLRIELIKYIDIYFALNQSTSERMVIVERLLDGSETKDKYGIGEKLYQEFEQNNKHIMKFCHSHVHTQFFQQVILFGYHQMNELGAINTPEKLRHAIQIQMQLFDNLCVICQSLIRNFQIAVKKLPLKEITSNE